MGAAAALSAVSMAFPVLAAQPAAADATVVPMVQNTFQPSDVVVPLGSTVTWTNTDAEAHDVTPSDPSFSLDLDFFSPIVDPGMQWSFTFVTPGVYAYMCDLHANMIGTITVQ